MTDNITSVAAIAGAVGAFVAAIVVSLSNVVVTLINKKAEERKHYRELIINAAIENYKEERSMAKMVMEKRPEVSQIFYPMDDFIIQMSMLAGFIIDKKLQPEELKEALVEMDKIRKMVQDHRNKELPEHLRKSTQ